MGSFITDDIYKSDLTAEQIEAAILAVHNKTITAADVGASNPNLLINGDFRINQRDQSSYTLTAGQYFLDGCRAGPVSGTVTVTPIATGGITITKSDPADYGYIYMPIEFVANKAVTLSISLDGVAYTVGTGTMQTVVSETTIIPYATVGSVTIGLFAYANNAAKAIIANEPMEATVNWVKLEYSTVATLDVPEKQRRTLADCQRYYYQPTNTETDNGSGALIATAGSNVYLPCGVQFPTRMRIAPTITLIYVAKWDDTATNLVDANMIVGGITNDGFAYIADLDSGFSTGETYYIKYIADAEIY
jgi:hypothetical protein